MSGHRAWLTPLQSQNRAEFCRALNNLLQKILRSAYPAAAFGWAITLFSTTIFSLAQARPCGVLLDPRASVDAERTRPPMSFQVAHDNPQAGPGPVPPARDAARWPARIGRAPGAAIPAAPLPEAAASSSEPAPPPAAMAAALAPAAHAADLLQVARPLGAAADAARRPHRRARDRLRRRGGQVHGLSNRFQNIAAATCEQSEIVGGSSPRFRPCRSTAGPCSSAMSPPASARPLAP